MELNFNLHAKQREIFVSEARYKVCAAGRRAGKSYLSAVTLIIEALKDQNRYGSPLGPMVEVWYVAPTYQQGRDIIWNMLKQLGGWGTPNSVISQVHENTSTMTMINGRAIKVKGSDRPDTLRGNSLSYVVMDEYAFMKPEVWDMILGPALSDSRGDALFIGTPSGKNHFYDLWMEAHEADNMEAFHFNSTDNPIIDPEEVEDARSKMSIDAFRQEFEASFEAAGGGAFQADYFLYAEAPMKSGTIYITVDPAGFGKGDGMVKSQLKRLDECAIAVVEVSSEGWFVHDMISGRWSVRETSLQIIRAAQKYRAAAVGIEAGSLKNAIMPYLEDQMRRLNIYPRVESVRHGGQEKTQRILWALQGRFQNERIILKKDQPWNKKLTDQLLDFPNPLAHDDLPDALAYIDQISTAIYDHGWIEGEYKPLDEWAGY